MLKKNIVTLVLSLSSIILFTNANAMSAYHHQQSQNTISFSTQSSTTVKSDTALVQVTVNATAMKNSKQTIEQSATAELYTIVPHVKWDITHYQQNQAASGVTNIKMELQSRLTQSQIMTLTNSLKKPSAALNQTLTVKVLNYNPSPEMIENAKQSLMISMYQSLQKQLEQFNSQTHSNYHIQNVSFNNANNYYAKAEPMMLMAEASNSTNQEPLTISHKISLTAQVTFSETPLKNNAPQMPATQKLSKALYGNSNNSNWPT